MSKGVEMMIHNFYIIVKLVSIAFNRLLNLLSSHYSLCVLIALQTQKFVHFNEQKIIGNFRDFGNNSISVFCAVVEHTP